MIFQRFWIENLSFFLGLWLITNSIHCILFDNSKKKLFFFFVSSSSLAVNFQTKNWLMQMLTAKKRKKFSHRHSDPINLIPLQIRATYRGKHTKKKNELMNLPTIFLYFVKPETFSVKNSRKQIRERERGSIIWMVVVVYNRQWWTCQKIFYFSVVKRTKQTIRLMFVDYISQMLFTLLLEFFCIKVDFFWVVENVNEISK